MIQLRRVKILITDEVHKSLIQGFEKLNYTVDYQPYITLQQVHQCIGNYFGIVINTKIVMDRELIAKAEQLQVVARLGSGKEILDLPYLHSKGIQVITTPEANCNAVAEHALGMLLSLVRNIPQASAEVKEHLWNREKNRGFEISNLCFGIIGYGHTGKRFCEILKGFGCSILIYDPFVHIGNHLDHLFQVETMDELLSCDVISYHVSYLPENKYLFDHSFIESMKRNFWLINTSRGLVVDVEAVLEGLQRGKIRGACLDVLENENPKSLTDKEREIYTALFQHRNVILTPHIAGWTFESKENIAKSILHQWPKS